MKHKTKKGLTSQLISLFSVMSILIVLIGVFGNFAVRDTLSTPSSGAALSVTSRPSSEPIYSIEEKAIGKPTPLPTWTPPADSTPQKITGFDVLTDVRKLVATPLVDHTEPWPTETPLPQVLLDTTSRYSAQAVKFQRSSFLDEDTFKAADGLQWHLALSRDAVWSQDGKSLAVSFLTTEPVIDTWTDLELLVLDQSGRKISSFGMGYFPVWSPSSLFIAYHRYDDKTQEGYVHVAAVDGGKIMTVTRSAKKSYLPTLSWISDNELLFFQQEYFIFDLLTGATSKLLPDELSRDIFPTPLEVTDRRASVTLPKLGLIAIEGDAGLVVLHRQNGEVKVLQRINDRLNFARSAAFSPDGELLAFNSLNKRNLKIVNLANEKIVELPSPSRGILRDLNWSPDSTSIIFAGADGVHIVNRDGSGYRKVEEVSQTAQNIFWASTGELNQLGSTKDDVFSSWTIAN